MLFSQNGCSLGVTLARHRKPQCRRAGMTQQFFERPILNSPYAYPARHWELDEDGQPTDRIIDTRRRRTDHAGPEPKKRRAARPDGDGLRRAATVCRARSRSTIRPRSSTRSATLKLAQACPTPTEWQVTPETARLLQHWRHHPFQSHSAVLLPGRGGRDGDLAGRGRAESWASVAKVLGAHRGRPTNRPIPNCCASRSSWRPAPARPRSWRC